MAFSIAADAMAGGGEASIRKGLAFAGANGYFTRIRVVRASQTAAMDRSRIGTRRSRRDSTIVLMAALGATGAVDVMMSPDRSATVRWERTP